MWHVDSLLLAHFDPQSDSIVRQVNKHSSIVHTTMNDNHIFNNNNNNNNNNNHNLYLLIQRYFQ